MAGTLYIVATPIGNLEDITLRAISILSDVDIILAEDTRVTKKLLFSLNDKWPMINAKLLSYHQHSGEPKKLEILSYLNEGKNIALVTDAGTPGISDPGNELIDFLLEGNPEIKIAPVPGASSITSALSVSGFRANKFVFLGFMPKKKRNKLIKWIREGKMTFSYFDSPNRVIKNLELIKFEIGSDSRVLVARELTKMHETLYRGSVDEVIKQLKNENSLKGEIVVVIEGN